MSRSVHTVDAGVLQKFTGRVFAATGAPADVADTVAELLVRANLCGVDSHGVIRIPSYVDFIDAGRLKPAERPRVAKETASTGIVDGRWGFGQPTAIMAMELAIGKARKHGVGTVVTNHTNHVGRLADYTELATRKNMIGLAFAKSGPDVAPWQGMDKLLGTNPVSFGIPAGKEDPIVADFATSISSRGKINVMRAKGMSLPPGWVLDKDGSPSTDPAVLDDGGVVQTFGARGYMLNLVVEALGGALTGGGVADEFEGINGTFVQAISVEHFTSLGGFRGNIDKLVRKMRGSKPARGYDEVLIPGDPERRAERSRELSGIEIVDAIWDPIMKVAKRFDVEPPKARARR
ncbi:MAG: Ldh family oxidoreductase [Thaumarchaeota archaeon]|nr:Ldh family oxidoreductase [Nitrososphaerota archaeon]